MGKTLSALLWLSLLLILLAVGISLVERASLKRQSYALAIDCSSCQWSSVEQLQQDLNERLSKATLEPEIKAIRAAILSQLWVKQAVVYNRWQDGFYAVVTEKAIVGRIASHQILLEDGTITAPITENEQLQSYPLYLGAMRNIRLLLPKLESLYTYINERQDLAIAQVAISDSDVLTIVLIYLPLNQRLSAVLGSEQHNGQIQKLQRWLARTGRLGEIESIDFRYGSDKVAIKPR